MITNNDKQEMIALRGKGWSTVALGIRYGVDHTTIIYHLRYPQKPVRFCRRKAVRVPNPDYHPARMVDVRPMRHAAAHALFVKARKSYADHLREATMRVVVRGEKGEVISVMKNEEAAPVAEAMVREYYRAQAVHKSDWPPSINPDLSTLSTA